MGETIAAISTAPGEGGIGIVRISGENAENILSHILASKRPPQNRSMTYGHIVDPEENVIVDEVLAVLMRAPKTYTGEDVAEIHCHGGMIAVNKILSLCLRQGARLASPGEFTRRAFFNGRIDLSQAEAVIDLIQAKTDRSHQAAMIQLEGQLSEEIRATRQELLDLLVQITVNIDYPDEDIEELLYEDLMKKLEGLRDRIQTLLSSASTGKVLRDGLPIAIIGRPNAGKSSLLNQLLQETRAIVTEIPGTTRDTIEEMVSIRNIPVVLTDTAGIRNQAEDPVEAQGIRRSRQRMAEADLVLYVIDGSKPLEQEDRQLMAELAGKTVLPLLNKEDLGLRVSPQEVKEILPGQATPLSLSLKQGTGVEALKDWIEHWVYGGKAPAREALQVTNARHDALLEKSLSSLEDALQAAKAGQALDFVQVDVNQGYESLGEIIGESVSDEVLETVFSRFCLGK